MNRKTNFKMLVLIWVVVITMTRDRMEHSYRIRTGPA